MSQSQIEDIYERLNRLSADMTTILTIGRIILIVGGTFCTGIGATALAIFVWWLNKH